MTEDTDRTEGVNFSDVESIFEDLSYPVTAEEIVSEYGDRELERTKAEPITLRELFEPMGDTRFESTEDLRTMILGQMPEGTGGRSNYSDRGGSLPTETEAAEEAADQTSADLAEGKATDRDRTDPDG